MTNIENKIITKRIIIYLCIVMGFLFGCGVIAAILPKEMGQSVYRFLAAFFTAIPVLGALFTRWITGDKTTLHISLKVWKNWKIWLFSAFAPGIAILVGIILFYVIFPSDLDLHASYLTQNFSQFGIPVGVIPSNIYLTKGALLRFGFMTVLISAICIPLQLLELGEEIGWRAYLLPLLCKKMTMQKAVLIDGVLWGIAHAPIVYFGFNYGTEYAGAPWTGITMMVLIGVVIGIWNSYVFLKTGNVMYSAIIHGVVNLIGETGVFVSRGTQSVLLGPNPTGLIGLSMMLITAIILFMKIKNMDYK